MHRSPRTQSFKVTLVLSDHYKKYKLPRDATRTETYGFRRPRNSEWQRYLV